MNATPRGSKRRFSRNLLRLVLALTSLSTFAQSDYPYLVENLTNDQIVRRGVSDVRGIPSTALILRPNTAYRLWMLESNSLRVGVISFRTSANGRNFMIPTVTFRNPITPDSDGDGLHDEAEFILGTNAGNPDTDSDGLADGAEFAQGLDPLDGLNVLTGIIASADTEGEAINLHAFDDLIYLVERGRGLTVFNVFNAMAPIVVARVSTPGDAIAVHASGDFAAVADGSAGLSVIDVSDPPAALILHQVALPDSANAVVTTPRLAFVCLSNGSLVKIDLASGTVLETLALGGELQDVTLSGNHLYVAEEGFLHTVAIPRGAFVKVSTIGLPGVIGAGGRRLRLFAGVETLYTVHNEGYNTFNITDPGSPVLITAGDTSQQGWKRIVTNGNGLGIAAVSPNSTDDGPHHISLYDTSDPTQTDLFLTTFETPGLAVDLVLDNGLAYVADSIAGLQVINVLAFDNGKVPPSIILETDWDASGVEAGSLALVRATVSDDKQVRNVSFYIDGVRAKSDGNYPFEYRFITPGLDGINSFTLRARATDTGGNVTWTNPMEVSLLADATPPLIEETVPVPFTISETIAAVRATFNEPIQASLITGDNFLLTEAGSDGDFDTADDQVISGTAAWLGGTLTATLTPSSPLADGRYRAELTTVIADQAGNTLPQPFSWNFFIGDGTSPDFWWPGEDSGQELVTGMDGTLLGGIGFDTGKRGRCFLFDNMDDGVEIPNTGGIFNLTDAWTVEAWVFPFSDTPTNQPGSRQPIIWKIDHNGRNGDTFALNWYSNSFATSLERASDDRDFNVLSNQHQPGKWYHVVGVYDGRVLKIYVNGTLEGENTIGSVVAYIGPAPLRIGNLMHSNHGFRGVFDGCIDEVKIYRRALTNGEVLSAFQFGKTK